MGNESEGGKKMEKIRSASLCFIMLVMLMASVALGNAEDFGLEPPPPPPSAGDVVVVAVPSSLPANGFSRSTIIASVINATKNSELIVTFSITSQPSGCGAALTNASYKILNSSLDNNAYTELIAGVVTGQVIIKASCLGLENTTLVELVTAPTGPTITGWYNNKTKNNAVMITINESECVYFNATATQPIDTWRWFVDGVDQAHNFNEFIYCGWSVNGTYQVNVNGTNASMGDSNTVTWTVIVNDITPPAQVTGLTNGTPTYTAVDLWWASNAEPDLAGYKVYQNGGLLDTTPNSYYNVTGLSADTVYTFNVSAYDDNGLEGEPATVLVATPAYLAPVITDWYNNKTQDNALQVTIFETACIYFNVTADQPIDTWSWFVDGVNQAHDDDEFTTCWTVGSDHSVAVNGTNTHGTTNTVIWTVRVAPEDTEAPLVTDPTADPYVIPDDTDNEPLWGELATLSVLVTDASEITSVTINLSSLGGSAAQPMTQQGASDLWSVSTNASLGTAGWTGSAYVPHQLQVTATDEYAQSNTSVSIALLVMKNGDVDVSGDVNLDDAIYLANYALLVPGFDLVPEIADVDGSSQVNLEDAIYLANHALLVPGYQILH